MKRMAVHQPARTLLALALAAGSILLLASCTREVVKEVPVEVIKEVPVEKVVEREVVREVPVEKVVEKEVVKEVPTSLTSLAEGIRAGTIGVGSEYGLAFDRRYHSIHAVAAGLACAACHTLRSDAALTLFSNQDTSPVAPGPVDRRACLGCHLAGGPARVLYSAAD